MNGFHLRSPGALHYVAIRISKHVHNCLLTKTGECFGTTQTDNKTIIHIANRKHPSHRALRFTS